MSPQKDARDYHAMFDRARAEIDPLADVTVAAIFEVRRDEIREHDESEPDEEVPTHGAAVVARAAGAPPRSSKEAFGDWTRIRGPMPTGAHASVDDYLEVSARMPSWRSQDLVDLGENVYCEFGPECMLALLLRSLPAGYNQHHVAETLHMTGRMTEDSGSILPLTRRILETLQFLVYVMTPGGLDEGGVGVQATQKVRLIHAAIRSFIVRDPRWNRTGPPPINQEELVMTMLTFSVLVIDGLRDLGMRLDEREQEAILHMWKIVGHVLGIRDEYMPRDVKEAREMWTILYERNRGASPAGVELTTALIDYVKSICPGKLFDFAPALLLRYLNGREIARDLGVRPLMFPFEQILMGLVRIPFKLLYDFEKLLHVVHICSRSFNVRLLQGLLLHWNDRKKMEFDIPASLRGEWGLPQ